MTKFKKFLISTIFVLIYISPVDAGVYLSYQNFPDDSTTGYGINNNYQIVGMDANGGPSIFILYKGQFTYYYFPGSRGCFGTSINDAGDFVGQYYDINFNMHGFLYSGGQYTTIDYPNASGTFPTGINNAGQIVGTYLDQSFNSHGFLYSGGQFTTIDYPGSGPTPQTFVQGINNLGQIVGNFIGDWQTLNNNTFIYLGGQFTTYYNKAFLGINDSGQILGQDLITGQFYVSYNGNDTIISYPGAGTTYINGFNNIGEVVGSYLWDPSTSEEVGFVYFPLDFVDPVPNLINDLNTLPLTQNNYSNLGFSAAPIVSGVAADGAAEIFIRIPSGQNGLMSIINDQGNPSQSSDEDGVLIPVGGAWCSGTPGLVCAKPAYAGSAYTLYDFVLYRAPKDFVRASNPNDATLGQRSVSLRISSNYTYDVPINIVRPPVALIHGLWSTPNIWNTFPLSNSPLFKVYTINYSDTNSDFIDVNSFKVQADLSTFLRTFKDISSVAAVQFDVITHSMGGLIIRDMASSPSYLDPTNYQQGMVHKLITLDAPHYGSQFASRLDNSGQACISLFNAFGYPVAGALHDLEYNSAFIQKLLTPTFPITSHLIAGQATASQESISYGSFIVADLFFSNACSNLFPSGGYPAVFNTPLDPNGYSDLIVSIYSQLGIDAQGSGGTGIGASGGPPASHTSVLYNGIEHLEGIPFLFPGPASYDFPQIYSDIYNLLDTWIGDAAFGTILP